VHITLDSPNVLTAEQFAELANDEDFEFQRAELVRGELSVLEYPELVHGMVVLNLSKALAAYLHRSPEKQAYAAYEVGLVVARNPDTIRRPAVSVFDGGERFAELDRPVTETRPALVIEVASTNDRRRDMRDRVESYLDWGVRNVWVADTFEKSVHSIQQNRPPRIYSGDQFIPGSPVFADFKMAAKSLFEMPG
jgi:Uma2 family endonuclease